ncbi:hypothetical protein Nepgr_028058 [Nepenthes gracilis]|uniref:Uncharacterized protein n=1 Tax=Nepenthes gracilis TaxID=150966 RepID=A0AAD3TB04_NEPGR|nr:hypothetical protein Nepgr_028058 [Nepenthes gracilis]
MEGSCIDEITSTTDFLSVDIPSPSPSPKPGIPAKKSTSCNRRVGSGTSVVQDSHNSVEAESRKLPSSKYKGVVQQPNGRWGAQIYEKHLRVWLGTFDEKHEAARAYDIAAQRFRGRDAVANLKPSSDGDPAVIQFLNSHSKAEIADMLRKHTFNDELEQSKRRFKPQVNGQSETNSNDGAEYRSTGSVVPGRACKAREKLFEKVVMPSDVGKLNRLVIPKQHAEKHFPLPGGITSSAQCVLLNFEDANDKIWRFKYSYWNSSQSYVLTKGWIQYVKEKNLKAGDIITFQKSMEPDKQFYIERRPANRTRNVTKPFHPGEVVFRLFGVDIRRMPFDSVNVGEGCNGKRAREMEFLSMESRSTKQVAVGALSD